MSWSSRKKYALREKNHTLQEILARVYSNTARKPELIIAGDILPVIQSCKKCLFVFPARLQVKTTELIYPKFPMLVAFHWQRYEKSKDIQTNGQFCRARAPLAFRSPQQLHSSPWFSAEHWRDSKTLPLAGIQLKMSLYVTVEWQERRRQAAR